MLLCLNGYKTVQFLHMKRRKASVLWPRWSNFISWFLSSFRGSPHILEICSFYHWTAPKDLLFISPPVAAIFLSANCHTRQRKQAVGLQPMAKFRGIGSDGSVSGQEAGWGWSDAVPLKNTKVYLFSGFLMKLEELLYLALLAKPPNMFPAMLTMMPCSDMLKLFHHVLTPLTKWSACADTQHVVKPSTLGCSCPVGPIMGHNLILLDTKPIEGGGCFSGSLSLPTQRWWWGAERARLKGR